MKKFNIFLVIILLVSSYYLIFYKETYVKSWTVKNSFEKDLQKEMRFLPLDYMGEYEYIECGKIYAKLKKNSKNIEHFIPKFANSFEEIAKSENINCADFKYLSKPYKYYDIAGNLIISGISSIDVEEYIIYNKQLCEKEPFPAKVFGDGNSMIISYGDEIYMISQWHRKNQYVIQNLQNTELICRFNVE